MKTAFKINDSRPHPYDPQHRDSCVQCDELCYAMQQITIPLRLGPVRFIFPLLTFWEQQAILKEELKTPELRTLVKQRIKETMQLWKNIEGPPND